MAAMTLPRAGVLVLALLAAGPLRADTFVLIHGAFVGDDYWAPLVADLTAAGHTAIAVALTGQGSRIAEGGPDVSLTDHVADVVAAIASAPDGPVILVGHSYGTRPLTGAWDVARDQISHVVYIEGPSPTNDNLTALPGDDDSLAMIVMMSPDIADTGMLPPGPTLRERPGRTLASMSLKTLYAPVIVASPLPATPGTFIYAADSPFPVMARYAAHLAEWRGWSTVVLPGGHDVMTDARAELTAALLDIAARTGCDQGATCP
jgi:pimeloyl-ACP methyl ester carboxylesterase